MSLLLTKQIIQMFLMMFCGWMIVRLGVMRSEESRALSVITIFIICPASVLNAFQIDYTPEIADNFRLALRSGVMIHVIVFLTVYALNILFRFSGIHPGYINRIPESSSFSSPFHGHNKERCRPCCRKERQNHDDKVFISCFQCI